MKRIELIFGFFKENINNLNFLPINVDIRDIINKWIMRRRLENKNCNKASLHRIPPPYETSSTSFCGDEISSTKRRNFVDEIGHGDEISSTKFVLGRFGPLGDEISYHETIWGRNFVLRNRNFVDELGNFVHEIRLRPI